jgi:hypothetical protein
MATDDLLKRGIVALKRGHKAEARDLLIQAVEQDERNEMAWLWLSGAVDTDEDRCICLENVLTINPNNESAQRGLEILQRQRAPALDSKPSTLSPEPPPPSKHAAALDTRPDAEYEAGTSISPASDPPALDLPVGKAPACSVCGRQDETLRVVVYPYVFSLLVVSFRRTLAGIWCSKHRNLRLMLASLITALFGWLGIPYGFLWTPVALISLVQGGDQPAELNAEMLKSLAAHKIQEGDLEGAIGCLEASLQFRDDEDVRRHLHEIRTNSDRPVRQVGCWTTASALADVLLSAVGIGLFIGVLDYVITGAFSSLMIGDVPIFIVILSWTPFIMMTFVGGLLLFQVIEQTLTRIRCRRLSLAVGIGIVAATLAIYSLLQGSAISDYIAILWFSGEMFESVYDVIFNGVLVFLAGGFFWILGYIEMIGLSDAIYIVLLVITMGYYVIMSIATATRVVRWQQRLIE